MILASQNGQTLHALTIKGIIVQHCG